MEKNAIGFIELSSIARGIETADVILKAADTKLAFARESCPGKYCILFSGQVSSVDTALAVGVKAAGNFAVDHVMISHVHPEVMKALYRTSVPAQGGTLGVMEFYSVTAAIYAADCAVKTAQVELLNLRLGTGIGGKSFVALTGDNASVQEAVRVGTLRAGSSGMIVGSAVVSNPSRAVLESLY